MSNKRGQWLARRGQAEAELAIEQVIDQRPAVGEQIQLLADEQIADSPYQARTPFDEQSVEELAQGMRESGFQGILIVRPHSDIVERRRGVVQLLYGHRRRLAWRRVCLERGEPCVLPVLVREISDQQLLTIGAQENLQRRDLDPLEEAQIVGWHQQLYFEKNLAQIGALLGKSEDWVKTHSRIYKLPQPLKDRLRQRPRAISQILELNTLYLREPEAALALADRVVQEQLTLDAVREAVRNYVRPLSSGDATRDEKNNRRGAALLVTDDTTKGQAVPGTRPTGDEKNNQRGAALLVRDGTNTGKQPAPRSGSPHDERNEQRGATLPHEGLLPGAPGGVTSQGQEAVDGTEERSERMAALPAMAGTHNPPSSELGQASTLHPWLPRLCDRLSETTGALRQARGEISTLDHDSAARLSRAVEELLRELDLTIRALDQRGGA
jgi:ParB/RepB/Spo0J family partition protein